MNYSYWIERTHHYRGEDRLGAINPTTEAPYTLTDSRHPHVLAGWPAEPGLTPKSVINDGYCRYPPSDPRRKIKEKPFGSRQQR